MTRQDFREMDIKLNSIGKVFKLDNLEYKFISCNSYSWTRRSYNPAITYKGYLKNQSEFTSHPNQKKLGILLSFKKNIIEEYDGIKLKVSVVAFYTCGPCGLYTDVYGKIGDVKINGRALMSGTAQRYDRIEPVSIGNYLFYIDYSLNDFTLAVFKLKDW